ncbi:MAG: hypothetical protein K2G67_00780 [Muribaculaceae bacterium]|nr:hypothetical protein [Muribaculaceae bacterium]
MKKILNLMLVALTLVGLAGCGAKDAALKAQIESGQRHCPMNMGMAGKLTSMSYDSDSHEVKFVLTLNKDFADVKDLSADPEIAKESMRLSLSQGDLKKLLDMMVDADAGLKVVYKNRGSKDDFTLQFTPEDLKQIAANPMSEEESGRLLLANQIKSEKKRMPYKIDTGLTVTGIEDNGSALVYICNVDEDEYDIEMMENSREELKDNMRNMLKDISMSGQVKLLSGLGRGFEYRYIGETSGKEIVITFSADELKKLAKK